MVIQLQQGCCCSLKTATLVIGTLGIVTGLFMILATASNYQPAREMESMQLLDSFSSKTGEGEHEETFGRIMKVIMALIEIAMSTVLVVGAVKNRPKLVYPWIVLNVVQTTFATIILVTLAIYVSVLGNFQDGFFLIIALSINALLQGYMILVVNSYHTTILSPPTYDYTMKKDPIMYA